MKIAVIGCGYIGSAVALRLEQEGHEVTKCSRSPQQEYFLLTNNRLGDFQELLNTHEAIVMTMAASKQESYKETYLDNAKALKSAGSPKLTLYTSSTSVYGEHKGKWVDETTIPSPQSDQAHILFETENTLLSIPSSVCIFRLGEIYGPGRETQNRLKKMIGKEFPGTGDSFANRIHKDDAVEALIFAINAQLAGIYNLCHDEHPTRKELYSQLSKKHGLPQPKWNPSTISPHGGNKRVSNAKIKSKGYVFRHTHG